MSTNSTEQLKSLTAQVSALTRLTAVNPKWLLADVYIDIASSKTGSSRNESRSDNIKWGIKQRAAQGTSKLYKRKCYEYFNDEDGNLAINDKEAKNVRLIFNMYLQGKSVIGIVSELERLGIKSPTGNESRCKGTIDVMLSNEKYTGNVRLLDNGKHDLCYLVEGIIQQSYPKKCIKLCRLKTASK